MSTIVHTPYFGPLRWSVCDACHEPWPCSSLPEGGCVHCGSFRLDGRPPVLHLGGCPDRGVIPAWSLARP